MAQVSTENGVYFESNNVFSLDSDSNSKNKAFTTFEDMLEDALRRHKLMGEDYKYQFVPVYWALVNSKPINTIGMLRIKGARVEFSHIESGRREFVNKKACNEFFDEYKSTKPTSEECIAFSISAFNCEIRENPDTPYCMGYNLVQVPFDNKGGVFAESTILLLMDALVKGSARDCRR